MRNIYLVLIAAISICFFGCSKSSNSTSSTASMSAKINGSPWTANMIYTSKQTSSPIETVITGLDTATSKSISLYLFNYNNTTGNFTVDGTVARAAWINNYSVSGQIVVTSVSGGYISGTFNFVTYDTTQVTSGTFTAQLP